MPHGSFVDVSVPYTSRTRWNTDGEGGTFALHW